MHGNGSSAHTGSEAAHEYASVSAPASSVPVAAEMAAMLAADTDSRSPHMQLMGQMQLQQQRQQEDILKAADQARGRQKRSSLQHKRPSRASTSSIGAVSSTTNTPSSLSLSSASHQAASTSSGGSADAFRFDAQTIHAYQKRIQDRLAHQ